MNTVVIRLCFVLLQYAAVSFCDLQTEQSVYFPVHGSGAANLPVGKGSKRVRVKESELIYPMETTTAQYVPVKKGTPFYKGDFGKLPLSLNPTSRSADPRKSSLKKPNFKRPKYLIYDEHYPEIHTYQETEKIDESTLEQTASVTEANEIAIREETPPPSEPVTESAVIEKPPVESVDEIEHTDHLRKDRKRKKILKIRPSDGGAGSHRIEEAVALYIRNDLINHPTNQGTAFSDHADSQNNRVVEQKSEYTHRTDYQEERHQEMPKAETYPKPGQYIHLPQSNAYERKEEAEQNLALAVWPQRNRESLPERHSNADHRYHLAGSRKPVQSPDYAQGQYDNDAKLLKKKTESSDRGSDRTHNAQNDHRSEPVPQHEYDQSHVTQNKHRSDAVQQHKADQNEHRSEAVQHHAYENAHENQNDHRSDLVQQHEYDQSHVTQNEHRGDAVQQHTYGHKDKQYGGNNIDYNLYRNQPGHDQYNVSEKRGKLNDNVRAEDMRIKQDTENNYSSQKVDKSTAYRLEKPLDSPARPENKYHKGRPRGELKNIHSGDREEYGTFKVNIPFASSQGKSAPKSRIYPNSSEERLNAVVKQPQDSYEPVKHQSDREPKNYNNVDNLDVQKDYHRERNDHVRVRPSSKKSKTQNLKATKDSRPSYHHSDGSPDHKIKDSTDQLYKPVAVNDRKDEVNSVKLHANPEKKEDSRLRVEPAETSLEKSRKTSSYSEKNSESFFEQEYKHAKTKSPEKTEFKCSNYERAGIYADTETGCKVYHICEGNGRSHVFECPSGTLFDQRFLVCTWEYTTSCSKAQSYYRRNEEIYTDKERHVYL